MTQHSPQNSNTQTHSTSAHGTNAASNSASSAPKTKKRRAKSPQDAQASQFLRESFAPVRKFVMLAWLLDVLSVLLLLVQAWVLVRIFDGWLGAFLDGQALPAHVVGTGLLANLALIFAAIVGRAVLGFWRDKILTDAGLDVAQAVRGKLLDKLAVLGLARRDFGADGAIAAHVIDEPDHLAGFARFEVQKMTAVTTPIILAAAIATQNTTAALILLATAPLVPIFMAIIGIATAKKSRAQMDALAQLGGRFLDWIRGVNTLSRLGAVQIATADIEQSSEAYRKRTMDVLKIAFLNGAVLEFLSALAIALVAVYLGFGLMGILPWATSQVITTYAAALFILLLVPEFYAPLRRLGAEYHIKGQATAAAKAIAPMLAANGVAHGNTQITLTHSPSIALENVAAFGDDGRVRLSQTSLNFGAGKRTALIGESGSGKSTILQILLGFGAYQGDVWLSAPNLANLAAGEKGLRYRDVDVAHLRTQFGYLAQSAALLPLSIADNLRLAKPTASDDELVQVLKDVALYDVIRLLPQGLDTKLSERGGGLSGGQGQRLAIAQLMLQDAKVWLLDEPTEHLDAQTAQAIKEILWRVSAGKTVVWVTHDVADLAQFDQVYRLQNGVLDESAQTDFSSNIATLDAATLNADTFNTATSSDNANSQQPKRSKS
ncbi:ATP-binding/permease protein CydD [Moraxella caviae]|uniref:ATP-binding/permease protein CydD n=2 Tax=Moraxella caviae TaxID=34060 RepID=A0A378RA52_9GAMM|nr:thiol reductant ABC exporter subunit CydD [Moraxella caviae]STZ14609.1 ATP-binding/permease protein CydD [Moraxella caviae]VEW11378.1 ATP-binding/permease protein CydD [Moraxella caviae]